MSECFYGVNFDAASRPPQAGSIAERAWGLRAPHLRRILEDTVAVAFDVDRPRLSLASRGAADVARARQTAMYLAHVGCGLSLTEVGALFQRDRTTVAHACEMIEDRREDDAFDRALDLLEGVVRQLSGIARGTQ
jgi:Bacterial dnaA protein helix-turn-helix